MLRMFTESRFTPALTAALAMPLLVTICLSTNGNGAAPQATQPITHPATAQDRSPAWRHRTEVGDGRRRSLEPDDRDTTGRFELPARWRREPPASGARLAQAVIPGERDPANWRCSTSAPIAAAAWRATSIAGKGKCAVPPAALRPPGTGTVESAATGRRARSSAPRGSTSRERSCPPDMGGPTEEQPNFRLLGAVVEGPGGPWFFKATGPASTLAAARGEFLDTEIGAVGAPGSARVDDPSDRLRHFGAELPREDGDVGADFERQGVVDGKGERRSDPQREQPHPQPGGRTVPRPRSPVRPRRWARDGRPRRPPRRSRPAPGSHAGRPPRHRRRRVRRSRAGGRAPG